MLLIAILRGQLAFLQFLGECSLLYYFYANYFVLLLLWRNTDSHGALLSTQSVFVSVLCHSALFLPLVVAGLFIAGVHIFDPRLLEAGLHGPWHHQVLLIRQLESRYQVLCNLPRSVLLKRWKRLRLLFLFGFCPRIENIFHLRALMPRT